jgi:hypothetical protein
MSSSSTNADPTRIGPNPAILDQLLPSSDRKRSRPASSSLDYKATSESNLVTPPRHAAPSTQKNQQQQYEDQWSSQQEQQQQQRPRIATRARGSSGIPPRSKLELDDLQGMPEEEVMRALYEDPELAAAAAAQMEEDAEPRSPRSKTTSKHSRNKQRQKENQSLPGKREDLLKDQGFPFVQWIILLLLLGAGLYQIYKSFLSPKSSKAPTKVKGSNASGNKTTKPKQKANKNNKPVVVLNNRSVVHKKQPLAEEQQKPVLKEHPQPSTTETARKPEMKKKPRKPKVVKKKPDEPVTPEPEVLIIPKNIQTTTSEDVDQGEWQTVGTNTLTTPKTTDPQVVPADTTPKTATTKGKSKKTTETVDSAPEDTPVVDIVPDKTRAADTITAKKDTVETTGTKEEAKDTAAFQVAKPKKSKKKKKAKTGSSAEDENGDCGSTDGDAAMALELQQQEERAAKASQQQDERKQEEGGGAEDAQVTWEPVKKIKKQRRPKNES